MILRIRTMTDSDLIVGTEAGRALLMSCIAKTATEPDDPIPCLMDFTEITIMTASALLESVVAFKTFKRSTNSNHYPMVSNINMTIEEEIKLVLEMRGDAILCCDIDMNNVPNHRNAGKIDFSNVRLLGSLDPKQALTFDLVNRLGSASPATLMHHPDNYEAIGITAWNNRLAGLVKRGLLREFPMGRAKLYRPLLGAETFKSNTKGNGNDKPAGN